MQVDAREPEGRGDQRRGRLPVGTKSFSVEEQFGVEFPGTPSAEHLAHRRLIRLQQHCHGAQVGSEGNDRPDVQVAVRPAIETVTDTGRQRVSHRRVAQSALNADGAERRAVEESRKSNDCIEPQQCHRRRRTIEVDATCPEITDQTLGKCLHIHFQSRGKRGARTYPGSHSAERTTLDGFMQSDCVAPEGFIAEGIEAERTTALVQHAFVGTLLVLLRWRRCVASVIGRPCW